MATCSRLLQFSSRQSRVSRGDKFSWRQQLNFLLSAGVLINIECKAWAKNIEHDRQDRRGSVHFELMIDNAKKDKEN